jgi:hypothetical protein
MVAAAEKGPSKTEFLTEFLGKNPTANAKAVNAAWGEAGHPGSISPTLVQKIRSNLKLTGNIRRGPRAAEGNAAGKASLATRGPKKAAAKADGRARSQANGSQPSPAAERRTGARERERVLAEVERDLDRLIYRLMDVGGLESVADELRRVRRVVVRSHGG